MNAPPRVCKRCGRAEPHGGLRFTSRYFPHIPEWLCADRRSCANEIELAGQTSLQIDGPTLQAVETDEGTVYVLRRPGLEPISAHWPQPLLELEPDAVRVATLDPWPSRGSAAITITPSKADAPERDHFNPYYQAGSLPQARAPNWRLRNQRGIDGDTGDRQ